MKNKIVKTLTYNAIVLAIYFLLTFISNPISFGMIQIRIAELLVLLCFFNRNYSIGITIGCFLSNLLFSPIGIWDAIFGTLATLISCLLISFCKHLFIGTLIPVVLNGFVVAAELYFLVDKSINFFAMAGFIAIGEFIAVSLIGYIVFRLLTRKQYFYDLINANRSKDYKW